MQPGIQDLRSINNVVKSASTANVGANGAAAKLGLKRTTLLSKMKRLGVSKTERFGLSH
jgi:formate hydrogenlyase transcriptional activator